MLRSDIYEQKSMICNQINAFYLFIYLLTYGYCGLIPISMQRLLYNSSERIQSSFCAPNEKVQPIHKTRAPVLIEHKNNKKTS